MNKSLQTIPLLTAMLMGSHATLQAADNDDSWYFSPILSYIKADSDRQADDGFGLMLGLGKKVSDNWNIEVSVAMDNLDFETGSGEYKQQGLIFDGLYFFNRGTGLQTFGVVGGGFLDTDIGTVDSTNRMLNVGVGMMQQISDSGMKFRADIRYRMDMDDASVATESKFNDTMLNVGLSIPFGDEQTSKSSKAVNETDSNKDSDNDGVVDADDRCPGTAAGVKVDSKGCLIVVKEPVAAKEMDSDKDGVADNMDNCPDTASGVSVDTKGCELQKSFVLKGVNFVTGSNVLTAESKVILDDVAAILIQNSDLNVELAGYTDNRGNVSFNQRLSKKRAESVKAYLVNKGADENRMTAKGYGIDEPIADNASSEGRAKNRRVEMHIIK